MPQTLEFEIEESNVDTSTPVGVQTYYLKVTYRGEVDLAGQINEGENLSIEIPSHAPPPKE